MFLTLLYHHVNKKQKNSNHWDIFEKHLHFLVKNYSIVLPESKKTWYKMQLCLTFDDAYFDFFHFVYPLLQKLQIPCILAVPVEKILDRATLNIESRLLDPIENYCTWDELLQMQQSGLVKIASHSFSHVNLTKNTANLHKEVVLSKSTLEKKLQTKIDTFVYPYGKFNKKIHLFIKKHYPYVFRIGSSFNFSSNQSILYRVVADNLDHERQIPKKRLYLYYLVKLIINSLRRK